MIGSYDSVVAFGQKRARIVWQRIIMPDGSSLRIDNVPATDPSGYAGLADKVDFHTWQILKGVMLSTLLGVSSELALAGQSDLVQAIRMSTQDNVSRAGDQITQRHLGVQPTITIRRARRSDWWSTGTWCSLSRGAAEMAGIKLAKLPDRKSARLTISLSPNLKLALDSYAVLYSANCRENESVVEFSPQMLTTFPPGGKPFLRDRSRN